MGEQQRVAVRRQRALDHAVGARADLLQRLAAGDARRATRPSRGALADLLGGEALVVAVVALAQVLVDLGAVAEPGQLGGLAGALQRAREHERELAAGEALAQPARGGLARPRSAAGRCCRCGACERLHSVSPWRTRTTRSQPPPGSGASSRRAKSPCVRLRRRATRSWWYGLERLSAWPMTSRRADPVARLQPAGEPQRGAQLAPAAHDLGVGEADVLDPDRDVVEPDGVAAHHLSDTSWWIVPSRSTMKCAHTPGPLVQLDVGRVGGERVVRGGVRRRGGEVLDDHLRVAQRGARSSRSGARA